MLQLEAHKINDTVSFIFNTRVLKLEDFADKSLLYVFGKKKKMNWILVGKNFTSEALALPYKRQLQGSLTFIFMETYDFRKTPMWTYGEDFPSHFKLVLAHFLNRLN